MTNSNSFNTFKILNSPFCSVISDKSDDNSKGNKCNALTMIMNIMSMIITLIMIIQKSGLIFDNSQGNETNEFNEEYCNINKTDDASDIQ